MKNLFEHKDVIVKAFAEMQSMDDLLSLLNFAKKEIYGEKTISFSRSQLNYYSISKNKAVHYIKSEIPKKSGGVRRINAPVKGLKHLQACMNYLLQVLFEPHPSTTGFVHGKSIVDNAKAHIGKWFVYNLDLKDFFPSIEQTRVWACLQLPPLNLGTSAERKRMANRIAILCCAPLEFVSINETIETKSVLPQGAPTSPILTNLIAQKLDKRLQGVANKFHVSYTRYADDITFSSNRDIFHPDGEIIKEIRRIISDQNFVINEDKVRLQKQGYRQEVTGLIVNQKLNVPRRYTRQVRQWLYLWERYGYEKAFKFFLKDYLKDKSHVKADFPNMVSVIGGKLDYLKMVKGGADSLYQKLNERYLNLSTNDRQLNTSSSETKNVKDINIVLEKLNIEGLDIAMQYYLS